MADIFVVVADPLRRDLLQLLLERYVSADSDSGEASVGELVERLGVSQPTVSKHLKVLRDHGLVSVREVGQHRYYSLDSTPLEELEDWLIPFLSADFDAQSSDEDEPGVRVFAAWAGAEVAGRVGRRAAETAHQAREALHTAQGRLSKNWPPRR